MGRDSKGRASSWLAILPTVVVAILPRLACPCQMPAYAGLLGSMGLAFLMDVIYLLPLTAVCLTLSVGGLAVGARRRNGFAPFWLGIAAALLLLVGKFTLDSNLAVSAAIGLILLASIWNTWPKRRAGCGERMGSERMERMGSERMGSGLDL